MQNIIVLEDDPLLIKALSAGLKTKTWRLLITNNLEGFSRLIKQENIALCVMDRLIKGNDSLSLVGEVRELLPQAKILLLSKKSSVMDRVEGLENGADDYLAKPFSLAELRLRIKTLLSMHRMPMKSEGIDLGEVIFYPDQGMLKTSGGQIFLRRRETQILVCLARAAGAVVSRDYLSRVLWSESFVPNPSTIDVYVRRLRHKLGKYQSILQTRRGFGYHLVVSPRKI